MPLNNQSAISVKREVIIHCLRPDRESRTLNRQVFMYLVRSRIKDLNGSNYFSVRNQAETYTTGIDESHILFSERTRDNYDTIAIS